MAKPEICKKCTHENVPESGFPCHLCGYLVGADKSQIGAFKKKQTNADRIRAMSDEELAEFINMVSNDSIDTMVGYKDYTEIWEDKEPTLQWLKSEVKE